MNKLFISSAVALTLTSTPLAAGSLQTQGEIARFGMEHRERIWLTQGNNGNGHGNDKAPKKGHGHAGKDNPGNGKAHAGNGNAKAGKGNDDAAKGNRKPEHAGGPKFKANGKGEGHASQGNGKGAKERRPFTTAARGEAVSRIISTPAPSGRDMKRVLSATALALASPHLLVADIPEDELITYRNCPPGLAKKDPPCVPPGLANKGVTYDEWASYDQEEYDTIWVERRDDWISSEAGVDPDPELLLLQSDQIATLYDLDPAPEGKRYGLIDGMPVLLDQKDYDALLLVNQMAQVPDLVPGTPITPTAALTQDDLIDLYRLPQLGENENYAVVNGQVVRLNDTNYELLQMLRVARAVL